jgi:predicted enzyme related to lactoylglutathione lyase
MEWKDNLTGLQHLGIPTKDIDKTIAYYQMIGFTLAHETMNGENRVAFLKWKDLIIETYESDQVSEVTGVVDHIAMNVLDIEAAYEHITSLDVKILEGITCLPTFWGKGIKYFLTEGPNKERLEYTQYL